MKPIISAYDVSMEYESADGNRVRALSDVSFQICEDEFICLVGSNASGKTTLLNLICREFSPTSGEIHFRDQNISDLRTDHWLLYLGRIYQNSIDGLAPFLTVRENLLLSLLKGKELNPLSSVYSQRNRRKLDDVLRESQIDFKFTLNKKVNELSGGQKQLLALMMIYLQEPGILLLDEPTASLDPQNCKNVINLLSQWSNEQHNTILMATHQVEIALSLLQNNCRIFVLHEGRIKARLTSEEISEMSIDDFKSKYYT